MRACARARAHASPAVLAWPRSARATSVRGTDGTHYITAMSSDFFFSSLSPRRCRGTRAPRRGGSGSRSRALPEEQWHVRNYFDYCHMFRGSPLWNESAISGSSAREGRESRPRSCPFVLTAAVPGAWCGRRHWSRYASSRDPEEERDRPIGLTHLPL